MSAEKFNIGTNIKNAQNNLQTVIGFSGFQKLLKLPSKMHRSSVLSEKSISSVKSHKSGKSVTEKIRDLGFDFPVRRSQTGSIQLIDIKFEDNRSLNYTVMVPDLNLEQIVYYQPEFSYDEANPERNYYKINKFDMRYRDPREKMKISDIEVVSYKPTKTMKFRKKKRRSSIITRIEEILNKNKGPILSRDPSEESIMPQTAPKREKTISDLPENVLQNIFSYFDMKERNLLLSGVCKSWYYILKNPMYWTEIEFSGENVKKGPVISLIRRYPSLKSVRMTSVADVPDILQELCRCNHSITDLAVRHCSLSPHDFARIILHVVSCCSNLEILDIKGMQFQSERFFLELGRLRNLRSINLNGNKMLRSQDLITLSLNCRNLRELRILDIAHENGQGSPLKDEDLTFILSYLQNNLEVLKVDMQQMRNVSFQAVLKCHNLRCLVLKNCLSLSSVIFRQFPVLKKLQKLKFTRAINLKFEDFQTVFSNESMRNIVDLDINGCWGVGEPGLAAITRRSSSLQSLSLKNCKSIKGKDLVHLSNCPKLTNLNIAHTEVQCSQLPTLYEYAKGLKTLVIDQKMCKNATLRHLCKFFPSLNIIMSYSEYKKDERPLIAW